MVSVTTVVLAALAVVASAAPACKPLAYTLPQAGEGDELAAPAANLVLKKIAIGHGIQNYSCETTASNFSATGALAVLYDATPLYPKTKKTGINQREWDSLPTNLLRNQPLPLNKLAGSTYGADPTKPFPDPADLDLQGLPRSKFLGHHFFDNKGVPVFDLGTAGLKAVVKKVDGIAAPRSADAGITGSGAVQWLQLDDNLSGQSRGIKMVYRVITAGGAAQACSVAGVGVQSVPYATFYWFYG
ncbi:hypothetical protein N657DRAFT_577842 [Parathielavia appendiculata]|uniref:Malate dehydrogenase n=1 Tax=Parathielavia appendiculata TaxID=2587402 RepID=A0AAN6TVH3_9PEZI|nr:hypothetical protein N657DRAFT_577842 [Parathielavia appendiculata]